MRIALASLMTIAACASGGRTARTCQAPDPDFLRAGEVYTECSVDQVAAIRKRGKLDLTTFRPASGNVCIYADIDVVVDTLGHPVMQTARVVRANDSRFAEIATRALNDTRFEPAKMKGRRVQQVARYESKIQSGMTSSAVGSSPSPTSAASRSAC